MPPFTMPSPIWIAVYAYLVFELVCTLCLVVPMPQSGRKAVLSLVNKSKHIKGMTFAIQFVAVALSLALYDSIRTIKYIEGKLNAGDDGVQGMGNAITGNIDKERRFRAQRNLYLTGFALTLLFVNMRLVQLMRIQVDLKEELKSAGDIGAPSVTTANSTEMQPVDKKTE
mmetsp:Transcript_4385/g.13290  ORF Transcript_4385/g.13290 Transcript_4385/m.13290 type:complete len:170 (-) Transcript_4385:1288-1797(-)